MLLSGVAGLGVGFLPRRKEVTRMDFFDLLGYVADVASIGGFVIAALTLTGIKNKPSQAALESN